MDLPNSPYESIQIYGHQYFHHDSQTGVQLVTMNQWLNHTSHNKNGNMMLKFIKWQLFSYQFLLFFTSPPLSFGRHLPFSHTPVDFIFIHSLYDQSISK